jgi:cytochrome c-type biogenesis protein CcmH/NrfG
MFSFEPDAEQKCEAYLEQALKIDPNSVEAYQTLASVRLSQQRPDDAKQALEKSIELWSHLDASKYTDT